MVMMPPRATGSPVRLLLADSRPLYRSGLARLLAEAPTLHVAGEVSSAPEVLEAVATLEPDVVVLDPALPGGALAMVRALRSRFPQTEVLLYGVGDDDALFIDALHAGVKGFADQTTDVHYLSSAIHSVAAGEVMVSPGLARHIAASYAALLARDRAGARTPHSELTDRELDVLRLVAAGRHNRTIAADLGLSEHTVRAHLRGISRKLGVQNRVQAVAEALRQGLIATET